MRKRKVPFPELLAGSPGDVNVQEELQALTLDGNSMSQLCSLKESTLHAWDFDLHKMKRPDWMSSLLLPTLKRGEHGLGGLSSFRAEPGKG